MLRIRLPTKPVRRETCGRNRASINSQASAPTVAMSTAALGNSTGGQPHDNMTPYLVVNFIIALFGLVLCRISLFVWRPSPGSTPFLSEIRSSVSISRQRVGPSATDRLCPYSRTRRCSRWWELPTEATALPLLGCPTFRGKPRLFRFGLLAGPDRRRTKSHPHPFGTLSCIPTRLREPCDAHFRERLEDLWRQESANAYINQTPNATMAGGSIGNNSGGQPHDNILRTWC